MKKSNNVGHSIKLSKETIDNLKIGIVVSRFNNDITEEMSSLCLDRLFEIGIKQTNIEIINVPGSFEIPVVISKNIKKYDGFVALGSIIKGETPHFDFISQSVTDSIMQLSINSKKPIGNGIITTLNKKQAKIRSLTKGKEAAQAVLSVLDNF